MREEEAPMASGAALMRAVPVVHLAQPPRPYVAGNCARSTSVPPTAGKLRT